MGYFDDAGYLNLNINISLRTIRIINIVFCSMSSLIQCAICITAVIKMRRNAKSSRRLEACFLVSSISGCTYTMAVAIQNIAYQSVYDNQSAWLPVFLLMMLSIGFFFVSLLCTVILKLYLTFKSSAFEMSLNMIRLFAVIVATFIVVISTGGILFVFGVYFGPLYFIQWGLYIIGCALAVYFFASNLLKLAKLQCEATSPRDLSVLQNEIKLTVRQQKSADIATKSMMLFAIQMGSTIFFLLIVMTAFPMELRAIFASFDIPLNLFCSYFQFAFAQKHYRKCCGFCDDKFQGIMMKWIKRKIFTHSLSRSQAKTHMANVRSTSIGTKKIQCI